MTPDFPNLQFLTSTLQSAEFQLAPWHPTRLFANTIAWYFHVKKITKKFNSPSPPQGCSFLLSRRSMQWFSREDGHMQIRHKVLTMVVTNSNLKQPALNEEARRHRKASNSLSTMINFIGWLLEVICHIQYMSWTYHILVVIWKFPKYAAI